MKLFIVPSWFPSKNNPLYGVFVQEQVAMMARLRPEWKIGVSLWGQGDPEKQLWLRDHLKNVTKIRAHARDQATSTTHAYAEYYQPALSWSKRYKQGNIAEIIRCNERNYQVYVKTNGTPDAILVQASYPGALIGHYLSSAYGVPWHLHVRLGGFMFKRLLKDLGTKMQTRLLREIASANLVTVTSNFHSREVAQWISSPTTLYNPVDTAFFVPTGEQNDFALAVGRIAPEKGFDLLVEACAGLTGLKVKVVGEGDGLLRLSNGSPASMEWLGMRSRGEVRTLMQRARFLIMPSRYETFGNVVAEALACGKPVVATKCGGPQEMIDPSNGRLSEIQTEDLREKIMEVNDELRTFDSKSIRSQVMQKLAPNVWLSRLEALLTDQVIR